MCILSPFTFTLLSLCFVHLCTSMTMTPLVRFQSVELMKMMKQIIQRLPPLTGTGTGTKAQGKETRETGRRSPRTLFVTHEQAEYYLNNHLDALRQTLRAFSVAETSLWINMRNLQESRYRTLNDMRVVLAQE